MFSDHSSNKGLMLSQEKKLMIDDLALKIKTFLTIPDKILLLIMDSCESNTLLLKLRNILTNEEIARMSFAGYFGIGHTWRMKNPNCSPLGGFVTLALLNSIAIFQEKKISNLRFEDFFKDQAKQLFLLV